MTSISVGNPFKSFKRPNKSFKPTLFLVSSSSSLLFEVDVVAVLLDDFCTPVNGV